MNDKEIAWTECVKNDGRIIDQKLWWKWWRSA